MFLAFHRTRTCDCSSTSLRDQSTGPCTNHSISARSNRNKQQQPGRKHLGSYQPCCDVSTNITFVALSKQRHLLNDTSLWFAIFDPQTIFHALELKQLRDCMRFRILPIHWWVKWQYEGSNRHCPPVLSAQTCRVCWIPVTRLWTALSCLSSKDWSISPTPLLNFPLFLLV